MVGLGLTAALTAAAFYGVLVARGLDGQGPGPWVKTASVALLAVERLALGAPGLVVLGLALGAMGDFALTRRGEAAFLAGMAAFAAGHLAYAAAFGGQGLVFAGHGAVLGALALLIGSTEVWLAPHTGALRWPVRAYGVVIGLMAAVVVLLPPGRGLVFVQAGAALFVLSDLLLALRLFRVGAGRAAWGLAVILWPAYWCGQALILLGSVIYGGGAG